MLTEPMFLLLLVTASVYLLMGDLGEGLLAPTPLQRHLRRLVRAFGLATAAACIVITVGCGLLRGDWMQGLLSAIALGMAMLPEEFPMALAVFLALGARRLARIQVLSGRPAVIEVLCAATVLCVDKTGTLTENRMRLRRPVAEDEDVAVESGMPLLEGVHRLPEFAMLASRRGSIDPLDWALLANCDAAPADTEHLHPDWQLTHESPLRPELLAMSHEWTDADGQHRIAAKAHRKRCSTCATWARCGRPRCCCRGTDWRQRGCACWPSRKARLPAAARCCASTTA